MNVAALVAERTRAARRAARPLARLSTSQKNGALYAMADALARRSHEIESANARDVAAGREQGLSPAMLDRLLLTALRVQAMAAAVRHVATLPDPVGETVRTFSRPNGLVISQVRVPLGVVGVIYESRPNVTADAAALTLKSGNAVVLRGGSEAFQTNSAIARVLADAAREKSVPEGAVGFIDT
ncbi:MAG: aldehyde dehydrogenase family protein, partial [Planctomycetes bacterium]|nr:aldehyde dehydrogenase family protein [Planctomycetota bacterium]